MALYSVAFGDVLGATVRDRRKGAVQVYIDEGPSMFFRVEPNGADALQALVERMCRTAWTSDDRPEQM